MDQCGLLNLGFHGLRVMWINRNPVWQCNIKKHLDSGLGAKWKIQFPKMEVHHLLRVKSDHRPILLITDPMDQKAPNPFQFK